VTDQPPVARLRRSRGFALVWLVPVGALALVIWLGVRELIERGPLVTITFETAEGLEAGHTKVRYKSVDVGTVESVALSEDLSHVVVTARIDRSAAAAVTSGASFWVVRPRLSPAGISGLNTLVSGAYLELQPGKPGHPQSTFKGLEDPPIADPEQPGHRFLLHAEWLGGLGQGAPIYHHGYPVGEVLGSQLSGKGEGVDIHIFVRAPYAEMVHPGSRFWNASGVSLSAGPGGIKASIESLQALVAGGIEFDTGPDAGSTPPSPAGAAFRLFDDSASAEAEPHGEQVRYIVNFPDAVHGLADNSAVELKGRYVGRVVDVQLAYDATAGVLSTPAVIEIEPEKVSGLTVGAGQAGARAATDAMLERLIGEGLRASLASGNLLTGQRLVALDIVPKASAATLGKGGAYPEIPAGGASDLDGLARSASRALDAVAAMPLADIGNHLRDLLAHLDALTGSEDAKRTLHSLNETLGHLNKLTADAETSVPALIKSLNETSDAATRTLEVLGGQAGRSTDLRGMMHELEEAARSMRALADFLQEHPEALVKGRSDEAK